METSELITGEYYHCNYNGTNYIFIKTDNDVQHINAVTEKLMGIGWNFYASDGAKDLRKATLEEQNWIKACVEQGKSLPKEQFFKDPIFNNDYSIY